MLAGSDEDMKISWKSCHEKLYNTEFACDMNTLSQADTVSSVPCLIDKGMVRHSISKARNGKAAGLSGLEMVNATREASVDLITD